MDKEIHQRLLIALSKIARETGEDEDNKIIDLRDIEIVISDKNIEFIGKYIRIYISEPYTEFRYNQNVNSFQIIDRDLIKIFNLNGKEFIKYPHNIERWKVDQEIFEDLKEEHDIKDCHFNENEWIKIQSSKEWKECQIQVARELIARKIIKYLEILV